MEAGIEFKAMTLCHEMRGEEQVFKSVSSQNNPLKSGELVDAVEDLIPRVLRHQADECIQADDCLFIEMIENGASEGIDMGVFPLQRLNVRIRSKKRTHRHRYLQLR